MNVKALRGLLEGVDDEVEVVIPDPSGFGYEPTIAKTAQLAEGRDGKLYRLEDLVFPPIDLVPVVIIQ